MEHRKILIDTSILIDYFRKVDKSETKLMKIYKSYETIFISSVTAFELLSGVNKKNRTATEKILSGLNIIPFDKEIAKKAAKIYRKLKRKNKIIQMRDIFIGATAIYAGLPIKTLNKKHFKRIENLIIK